MTQPVTETKPINGQSVAEKTKAALAKTVTVPATFANSKSDDVRGVLNIYKSQIEMALPKHLTPERLIQQAATVITRNQAIKECTAPSLIGAVLQASILGLEPVEALGQCYFVPFQNRKTGKKEVQFIIGYRGMLDIARRSGQIDEIYAEPVYSSDNFHYELGLHRDIKHEPHEGGDRGLLTHVYAVAKLKGGGMAFKVMSRADVDKIRARSKAGDKDYSPWKTDYDAMACKTVLRQLFKYLPVSVNFHRDVETDGRVITPESFEGGELNLDTTEALDFIDAECRAVDDGPAPGGGGQE